MVILMTNSCQTKSGALRATRRGVMFGAAALAVVTPLPALALSDAAARRLIDKVVVDINKVIETGGSLSSKIAQFEKIFARYGDVNIIARSALGADARRASASQMTAFTAAFRGYMSRKYGRRFNEFVGGTIEVGKVRQVKTWTEVITAVRLKGESPFEVKFLVSDRSGKDLFFDMVIEGISLRLSEKTEIGAMLDKRRGDIDALIADLRNAG